MEDFKENKKVKYSFFVDNNSKFIYQAWQLINSLIKNANVLKENIYMTHTNEIDSYFLNKCHEIGINTFEVEKFGDKKYCNKLTQLDNLELLQADLVVLMDTDMVVIENFEDSLELNKISGKIVDLPNPMFEVLEEVFNYAKINNRPEICKVDCGDEKTYNGNFNGGFYVIPTNIIQEFSEKWKEYALWLLDSKILHKYEKGNHVDQLFLSKK